MLPIQHRVRHATEFSSIIRSGTRSGGRNLVLYVNVEDQGERVVPGYGFIVSKAVGKAVVRNRVKRRLRALAAQSLPLIPEGTKVVVRALPAAAGADWESLQAEHDKALKTCLRRIERAGS